MKFLIDLNLDGYSSLKEEQEACIEFIKEQLDFSASYIKILWMQKLDSDNSEDTIDLTKL